VSITAHINNLDDYKKEVLRTCPAAENMVPGDLHNEHTWDMLLNSGMGLSGEAGEIIDHLKKCNFQGHTPDVVLLVKELGDVLWYVMLATHCLGVNPMYVIKKNVEKLRKRYPDGFETERSINRSPE